MFNPKKRLILGGPAIHIETENSAWLGMPSTKPSSIVLLHFGHFD
jgi:hypothetical protein